ncbi:MAG TPA: tetratricopeptide repeat protein, partial [Alphaproteobacteria bacterium]|nr:tetratricopeptide repeat protein [Alphaproteobacteria bacterium]
KEPGAAGAYLAGRYAQQTQDWDRASDDLNRTLSVDPDNPELIRRAMLSAMGAGRVEEAMSLARRVPSGDAEGGTLAILFLAVDDFAREDYGRALEHLERIPQDGPSAFILPQLYGWAVAGQGRYDPPEPSSNPLQVWHAALRAVFLNQPGKVAGLLSTPQSVQGLPFAHLETLADLCVRAGLKDKAKAFYRDLLTWQPGNADIEKKLEVLEKGGKETSLPPLPVRTARQGAALALLDIAMFLFPAESRDAGSQVFLQMALYLDPELRAARELLARLAARSGRYDEAIAQAQALARLPDAHAQDEQFLAVLLEDAGRTDEALAILEKQARERGRLESLIQIADLYARTKSGSESLRAYDRAFAAYGARNKPVPWMLYYLRGMMRERMGLWAQAESDLKAALALAPEEPYVLNNLGYGWADRGQNLSEALAMLKKAAALRPSDGYIADSLGWALYRSGRYMDAVNPMEKAVESVPSDSLINEHLGDVYWRVGRRREARFQWQRALNFGDDPGASARLEAKIKSGLAPPESSAGGSPQP